jgi:hypothetical protein
MDYKKIYDDLISKARSENRIKGGDIYYEAHHIIPKCMDGEGKIHQWKKHPNIILLTAKEHFVAHKLLCEIYPDNHKLVYALLSMCNLKGLSHKREYKISSREYQRIKINVSNIKKSEIGELSNIYGIKWSEERKLKHKKRFTGENHPMFGIKRPNHSKKMLGENNPIGQLTESIVLNIRKDHSKKIYTLKELCEKYNIKYHHLQKIIYRQSWKHI